ncbi:hypothetical protein QBC45DRAFT_472683 [Copromyces sp. CBS 386.78]|nr:hypothetical protein QBC45DRAFT_472683 [Copromyces sp. CBS 386.78]
MESTIEITQRIDRLVIAGDAPFPPRPALRRSSTSATSSRQDTGPSAASPASTPSQESRNNDVDMTDDIITGTRNLSLESGSPLQSRQHASWPRVHNRRRNGAAAPINHILSRQAACSPRVAQARLRTRNSRQGPEEANCFFRQCAQIRARHINRAHRGPQAQITVNNRARSDDEVGITREEHHRNLFLIQRRYVHQIRRISVIAARAGH